MNDLTPWLVREFEVNAEDKGRNRDGKWKKVNGIRPGGKNVGALLHTMPKTSTEIDNNGKDDREREREPFGWLGAWEMVARLIHHQQQQQKYSIFGILLFLTSLYT